MTTKSLGIKQTRIEIASPTYVLVSNGILSTSDVGFQSLTDFNSFDGSAVGITAESVQGAIEELASTPITGWFDTTGTVDISLLENNNKMRKLEITGDVTFTFSDLARSARTLLLLRESDEVTRTITLPAECVIDEHEAVPITINDEWLLLTILCVDEITGDCLVFSNRLFR
jgi:hypothetical protein